MVSLKTKATKYQKRIVRTQLGVAIVLSLSLVLLEDYRAAYSFALGSILPILANLIVARALLPKKHDFLPTHVLKRFYRAEALKYVAMILLMMIFFEFIRLSGLAFFIGVVVSYLAFGAASCIVVYSATTESEEEEEEERLT